MPEFIPVNIIQSALELGLIYSLVAMSLFVSFSILNIADLSTDGCFTLGCAVGVMITMQGHPVLAIFCAMAAGAVSGFVMSFLQTKLGIQSILAGIIVNTALYTVNLMVMGLKSNVSIFGKDTVFSLSERLVGKEMSKLLVICVIVIIVISFLAYLMRTQIGYSIRATGDSPAMVSASSINPAMTITVGLCISNSLTALSGCLIGQYNKNSDINLGTGMVTIALASLVIGQAFMGKGPMLKRIIGVVLGSVIYRLIVALALKIHISAEYFKLISAVIVAVAIASPKVREKIKLLRQKEKARKLALGGNDDA